MMAVGTVIACNTRGLIQRAEELRPGTVAACCRCGTVIGAHEARNLERTAAFTLSALIFYVPANVYPILRMNPSLLLRRPERESNGAGRK